MYDWVKSAKLLAKSYFILPYIYERHKSAETLLKLFVFSFSQRAKQKKSTIQMNK